MGKIAEKAVCRSVFLATWHCILSAELTKTHSIRLFSHCDVARRILFFRDKNDFFWFSI